MARQSFLGSLISTIIKGALFVVLLIAGLLYLMANEPDRKQQLSERTNFDPAPEPFELDPELQAERLAAIQVIIDQGYIDKVDGTTIPRVWITPDFYELTFENKKIAVSIVYAYVFPDGGDRRDYVEIRDGRSGNVVGMYGLAYNGLKMN